MKYVKIEFDTGELEKIVALKREYGLKHTTELIRFLITDQYKRMKEKRDSEYLFIKLRIEDDEAAED